MMMGVDDGKVRLKDRFAHACFLSGGVKVRIEYGQKFLYCSTCNFASRKWMDKKMTVEKNNDESVIFESKNLAFVRFLQAGIRR